MKPSSHAATVDVLGAIDRATAEHRSFARRVTAAAAERTLATMTRGFSGVNCGCPEVTVTGIWHGESYTGVFPECEADLARRDLEDGADSARERIERGDVHRAPPRTVQVTVTVDDEEARRGMVKVMRRLGVRGRR